MMRYKATFLVGLAAGYVLGARAGRERYEMLLRTGHRVVENPSVQEAAGVLQAQASDYANTARQRIGDKVGERVPTRFRRWTRPSESSYVHTRADGPPPGV